MHGNRMGALRSTHWQKQSQDSADKNEKIEIFLLHCIGLNTITNTTYT